MKKVFISGCYDILHAGHIQFFKEARALGNHLTVCFASDKVLWEHKKRRSSLPQDHKLALMIALDMVDQVVIGDYNELGLDFKEHFIKIKPDVLAVTEDDQYADAKQALCNQVGAEYVVLPKRRHSLHPFPRPRLFAIFALLLIHPYASILGAAGSTYHAMPVRVDLSSTVRSLQWFL